MMAPRNSIFRDKALKHYMQTRKKDVLPNFSSVPTAIFVWVLIGLLVATGLVAIFGQVPVSITGAGFILGAGSAQQSSGAVVLAFFPVSAASQLHSGQAARIQVSTSNVETGGVVATLESGANNPMAALERYGQQVSSPTRANQQMVVAVLKPNPGFQATHYVGSALAVQITTGTQSLFTAISGL